MEKDVLVILMVAFGLFAIFMFIMFFIYLKKYYNSKHLEEDYKKEVDQMVQEETEVKEVVNSIPEPINQEIKQESDMEFVPVKKK